MKRCAFCVQEIEGGLTTERQTDKLYFCSTECLDAYERENKKK